MLSPYRVLDLTDERGHMAGSMLARLGADVVLVEPPAGSAARRLGPWAKAGDVRSLSFRAFNRGKRSVVLDLEQSPDRDQLLHLAKGADLLVESWGPGRLAALDLGYDDLAAVNPGLVYLSISPFGSTGPKANWAATDLTLWAAAGPMALTGDADRAPLRISVPQSWHHAASQGVGGALLALLERGRSGRGQHVDVSAQLACTQPTQCAVLNDFARAPLFQRAGGGIKGGDIFLRFVYPAADGHVSITHVFGAALGPATGRLMDWVLEEGFCDQATRDKDWVMYAMDLTTGKESLDEFERVKDCVAAFTASKTKEELQAGAMERRLLMAPIASPADVAHSEQLAFRDYWEPEEDMAVFPGPWAKLSNSPLHRPGPAPRLGEHTAEVLAEPPRTPVGPSADASGAGAPTAGTDALPLAGVKVVDFMWAVAGPSFTRVLADYGATVVRVESSSKLDAARAFAPFFDNEVGAENSALFNSLNAGKLGLTLNLNKLEARDVVVDLVRWADVVCESFSPRAMKGWDFGYEQLRVLNPGVIMLSSCLFGQTGPLAYFAGYGNLAAAITGFYYSTGWPDRPPTGPYAAYTDYVAPQFQLATLLAALDHRRRTGEGQYVDFSQAEAALHLLAPVIAESTATGEIEGCHGNADPSLCPHAVYPCQGDDRWVAVACQDDAAWKTLAGLVGRPEWADLAVEARRARVGELDEAISAWTATRTPADVERALQAAGVAAHQVQNAPEISHDPQLDHQGYWVTVEHPMHGPTVIEGTRFALSRTPARIDRSAPTLGQHISEVLLDLLGYDGDRLAELAAAEAFD